MSNTVSEVHYLTGVEALLVTAAQFAQTLDPWAKVELTSLLHEVTGQSWTGIAVLTGAGECGNG